MAFTAMMHEIIHIDVEPSMDSNESSEQFNYDPTEHGIHYPNQKQRASDSGESSDSNLIDYDPSNYFPQPKEGIEDALGQGMFATTAGLDILFAHVRPHLIEPNIAPKDIPDKSPLSILKLVNRSLYSYIKGTPSVYKVLIVSLSTTKDRLMHQERWVREVKPQGIEDITFVCSKTTTMTKAVGHINNLITLGLGTNKVTKFTIKNFHPDIQVEQLLSKFPNVKHLIIERPHGDINFGPAMANHSFESVTINYSAGSIADSEGLFHMTNVGDHHLKTRSLTFNGNGNIQGKADVENIKLSFTDYGDEHRMNNFDPSLTHDLITVSGKAHVHVSYINWMARDIHAHTFNYQRALTNLYVHPTTGSYFVTYKTCSRWN